MIARGYVTCEVCNRSEVYCDLIDGLTVCESPECRIFCANCEDSIVSKPGDWCKFCITDCITETASGVMNIYRAAIQTKSGVAR